MKSTGLSMEFSLHLPHWRPCKLQWILEKILLKYSILFVSFLDYHEIHLRVRYNVHFSIKLRRPSALCHKDHFTLCSWSSFCPSEIFMSSEICSE